MNFIMRGLIINTNRVAYPTVNTCRRRHRCQQHHALPICLKSPYPSFYLDYCHRNFASVTITVKPIFPSTIFRHCMIFTATLNRHIFRAHAQLFQSQDHQAKVHEPAIMQNTNSTIQWQAKSLVAIPEMTYESIVPLYSQSNTDVFGEQMAFALSCSKHFYDTRGCRGCVHKLEVAAVTNFATASMAITHEVLPDEGASSQIIPVHDKLLVAGFDQGVIIPIKNFGYKKTFNCDVRAGLRHHCAPINTLAADSLGTQLASGSTNGEIALYRVHGEEIEFLSRSSVSNVIITGLAYLKPVKDAIYKLNDEQTSGDGAESMLIYSTGNGHLGLIDTRCGQGAQIKFDTMYTTEPRLNISTLCLVDRTSFPQLFFGTKHGHLNSIDLRCFKTYLHEQKLEGDGCIRRMKEVVVQDGEKKRIFLAYTNESLELRIIDAQTMKPDERWACDRRPEGIIQDFCQLDDRIVTCGAHTSVGCWAWEKMEID